MQKILDVSVLIVCLWVMVCLIMGIKQYRTVDANSWFYMALYGLCAWIVFLIGAFLIQLGAKGGMNGSVAG